MPKYFGNPVVSMNLTAADVSYLMKVGDKIDSITVAGPYEDTVYESATILAFSLDRKISKNNTGKILDGIPTKMYSPDDMANIRNAEEYFMVDSMLIEMGEDDSKTTAIIPIDKIKNITGTFETADGGSIVGTDTTGATNAIQSAADNTTVDIGEGEVTEVVNVSSGVTVLGDNAGTAQNFKQEV